MLYTYISCQFQFHVIAKIVALQSVNTCINHQYDNCFRILDDSYGFVVEMVERIVSLMMKLYVVGLISVDFEDASDSSSQLLVHGYVELLTNDFSFSD